MTRHVTLDCAVLQPPRPEGELIEIVPGILWLRMPLPMALNHINLYLVRNDEGWMIVDTGLDTTETRNLWDSILAGLDAPVNALLCTHNHNDHCGLAGWLTGKLHVPFYMSRASFLSLRGWNRAPDNIPWEHLAYYHRLGMDEATVENIFAKLRNMLFLHAPPAAYQRLTEGKVVRIGADRWRVILGDGHAPEHASLYCEERGILLCGDQLLGRITPNVTVYPMEPEENPLKCWLHSLQRFEDLPADTLVLPAHEMPFKEPARRARELREHHWRMLERTRGLCETGGPQSATALMKELFPRRKGPVDDLLAVGETMAHLVYLVEAGQLRRTPDAGGVELFHLP
ncbi:MAG: MBL fold metallo-hydrolase [Proteobacteria bacterium]|nr:MBL fold metallo-hydrolase [Pseudomonadota bacterium]HQR02809.1 MBL fold metallo-hydrolase [Rhodocyclaceae bacterium]